MRKHSQRRTDGRTKLTAKPSLHSIRATETWRTLSIPADIVTIVRGSRRDTSVVTSPHIKHSNFVPLIRLYAVRPYGGQEQPTRVVTAPPPLRLLRRGQIDSVIYARKSAVNRTRAALRCKLTHVWLSCNTAPAAAVIGRHIVRIYNICTANCHMHAIKYRVVYTYISAAQIALE